MRKFLVLSLLTILGIQANSYAQNLPKDSTGKVIYTEVVPMAGMTKEKIYERALKAINIMYKQADKKIAVKDPQGGLIQMNCTTQVLLLDRKSGLEVQSGMFKYKFNMYFKDGKYKYEFIGFHTDMGGYPLPVEKILPPNKTESSYRAPERITFLDEDIKRLQKILKENMVKEAVDVKSDW